MIVPQMFRAGDDTLPTFYKKRARCHLLKERLWEKGRNCAKRRRGTLVEHPYRLSDMSFIDAAINKVDFIKCENNSDS